MSAPPNVPDSPERPVVRSDGAWLVAALLCGGALMSPVIGAGPLALDEHGSYWLVDSDLPGTALERSLGYAAIPPLSAWLEQGFLAVFGKSELAFRLPSAVCYLAAIAVTWLIASQLADRTAGGLAALVLAWHPDLDEVRIARCYGLLMLLAALLLWCTLRWRLRPRSWKWPLIWSVTAAGLMWTHYVALPLIGVAGLSLLARPPDPGAQRIRWVTLAAAAALLVVLCLPLEPAIARMREWSPFLNYMPEGQPWWKIIGPLWWAGVPAGLCVAGLLNRALPARPAMRRLALPALWTLVPLLALVVLARGDLSSLANPRYRIPYAAGGACLIAVALRSLSGRQVVNIASVLALLGAAWSLGESRPWELRRLGAPADVEWRDAGKTIQADGAQGEPVFVQSGLVESTLVPALSDSPLFLEYIACRISRFYLTDRHPRIGLPFSWAGQEPRAIFSRLLADHDTFWVAAATDTDLNRQSLAGIEQLARARRFVPIHEQRGPNMTLLRYQRPAEAP